VVWCKKIKKMMRNTRTSEGGGDHRLARFKKFDFHNTMRVLQDVDFTLRCHVDDVHSSLHRASSQLLRLLVRQCNLFVVAASASANAKISRLSTINKKIAEQTNKVT
jgi:hypothetical protein